MTDDEVVVGQTTPDGDIYGYQLPVDYEKGFPHSVFATIRGVVFHVTYRFNVIDDSLVLMIIRARDGEIVFIGKLAQNYDIVVPSPGWHAPYFMLIGKSVTKDNVDIWLFPSV